MTDQSPAAVRLYQALAALLPPGVRADRDDMARAFAELRAEAPGAAGRWRLTLRSLVALAGVVLVEWLEYLGVLGTSRRNHGTGRGGMGFARNLRFALRTLRRAPAFSLTSIALVAVGVGAVTTVFTLVDHVLLRPLPYPEAERLVFLDRGSFTGPLFLEFAGLDAVERWGAAWTDEVNLVGEGEPLRLRQSRVSEDFFALFGARAERGRLLARDDFAGADNVVLDAGFWQRVFGGDPTVVGRTIQINGRPSTVVGIVDPSFAPPELLVGRGVDIWRPLDWSAEDLGRHDAHVLQIAGRLAPGADLPTLQAGMNRLMSRMADVHRNYQTREGAPREIPAVALSDQTVRSVRTGLGLLMGAVGLLLLIACANVANLFLARGLGRSREMAVRRAMGAGTRSLTEQLMAESLVVGLGGGALGIGLAWLGTRSFVALNPQALPRQAAVTIDLPVLLFAVGISAATSLVFGLLPALRSVRGDLANELRGAARSATSGRGVALLRNALVAGEVALSLVLVAGAGLLLRSFLTVQAQDPGFAVANVWTVPLNLPQPGSPDEYRRVMDQVLERAEAIPGVRGAAYALTAPLQFTGGSRCCWTTRPILAGREEDPELLTATHPVTLGYFTTVGVEIVAGRSWTAGDANADPVPVVVDETLAREIAGSAQGALGTTVGLGQLQTIIVGVARASRHYGLDGDPANALYLPMERLPFAIPISTLVVRVEPSADPAMARALREAVWAAAPALPVTTVRSMRQAVTESTAGRRFDSLIFGAFGTVALLLAAGGLYGTLLYVAGQRKRELGIRLALGASRGRIEAQVLRTGVGLGAVGISFGLFGAWLSNRWLESRIWGVERSDPIAMGGAAALLLATAVLASWLPARRAGRADPLETLREE
jgi:predicted permease